MPTDNLKRVHTLYGEFVCFSGDLITSQLEQYGAHTRNELAMVLDCVEPGSVVVDIGAHIGTYAIPFARKVGENGRVLAIEADPTTFRLLTENIALNNLSEIIEPVSAIVGDPHLHSLERKDVPGNTGAGFYVAGTNADGSARDAAIILNEFNFDAPDFIKVDVEGMELGVLSSLRDLLIARRPTLYVEISVAQLARHNASVEEIDSLLRGMGYRFFRNIGERNSNNDKYQPVELNSVADGGAFFDLLASTGDIPRPIDSTH